MIHAIYNFQFPIAEKIRNDKPRMPYPATFIICLIFFLFLFFTRTKIFGAIAENLNCIAHKFFQR